MRLNCRLTATLLAFTLTAGTAFASDPLKVKTDKGKVEGTLTTDGAVRAFKGIPYAAPPVGNLRWQPPQPAAKWHDTLPTKAFGPHCIQSDSYPDMIFHDTGASEDCLTLNVWTPANAQPGSLPVMVWIYGGGFVTGGTSEARQDGQFLAHHNVVIVSMNYRLGIFGFFAHPQLSAESPHHASGNYGLMDQAAAIAWVRRNISAFGGDPANITIFGQSAGAESVSALMASPVAKDLFNKAIGQSGSEFPRYDRGSLTLQQAEQANTAWATRTFGTSKLFALRLLPAKEILGAAMSSSAPDFRPIIDGYFLPEPIEQTFAAGKQAHVPLLGGWVANEDRPNTPTTADSFTVQAHIEFGPNALKFLALYPATTDAEAIRSAADSATDHSMAFPTWAWLEAQTKTGNTPIYRYFFDLPSPGDRNHPASEGAFHSDDIEYVFGALDSRPEMQIRPEDRALSELMQQYWTNFARTGDPNGPNLPKWPTYNAADNFQVMHLDAHPAAAPDAHRPRYLFLNSIWSVPAVR